MRRPLYIAVLLAVIMLPLAVQAQRSMGFRGSMPRQRMGSGFVSRPGPAFARPSSGFARPGFARPSPAFARPGMVRPVGRFGPAPAVRSAPAFRNGSRVVARRNGLVVTTNPSFHNRFHHHIHHGHFFFNSFNNCFNAFDPFLCNSAFGSPFIGGLPFYGSYYDPFYSDFGYSQPPPQQQPAPVEETADNRELVAQVQELSDQIQAMRDEERVREQSRYTPAPTSRTQDQETILVFRDGRRISVRNYAITGGTVWVLDEHAAHKYALSDFDPAATEQANARNGVEFRLPSSPEKH